MDLTAALIHAPTVRYGSSRFLLTESSRGSGRKHVVHNDAINKNPFKEIAEAMQSLEWEHLICYPHGEDSHAFERSPTVTISNKASYDSTLAKIHSLSEELEFKPRKIEQYKKVEIDKALLGEAEKRAFELTKAASLFKREYADHFKESYFKESYFVDLFNLEPKGITGFDMLKDVKIKIKDSEFFLWELSPQGKPVIKGDYSAQVFRTDYEDSYTIQIFPHGEGEQPKPTPSQKDGFEEALELIRELEFDDAPYIIRKLREIRELRK